MNAYNFKKLDSLEAVVKAEKIQAFNDPNKMGTDTELLVAMGSPLGIAQSNYVKEVYVLSHLLITSAFKKSLAQLNPLGIDDDDEKLALILLKPLEIILENLKQDKNHPCYNIAKDELQEKIDQIRQKNKQAAEKILWVNDDGSVIRQCDISDSHAISPMMDC
jgi:beta-N-acetylglucosaminidase